jgi:NADPH:quinone reductase-like Zn-dependent oxidoreductase
LTNGPARSRESAVSSMPHYCRSPQAQELFWTGSKKVLDKGRLLIMGAAGGLGSIALQAAKHLGAQVIAAAGTDARVDAARQLGADAGVNYRSQDLAAEVRRITGGAGVNVVLENIGDPELSQRRSLRLHPADGLSPPAATRAVLCRLTSSISI